MSRIYYDNMSTWIVVFRAAALITFIGANLTEACRCAQENNPVCGEDGTTYASPCLLLCTNWERAALGLPEIKEKCKGTCEFCNPKPCDCNCRYDPVCGTDGVSYSNDCWFQFENKNRKVDGLPLIGIECRAACKDCPKITCFCPALFISPVCGSDGVEYSNQCLLNCENKKRSAEGLPEIHVCCKNKCDNCPECRGCPCPKIYSPICGSDGRTYGNICTFNCENKYRIDHGLPALTVRCKMTCDKCVNKTCNCPFVYQPVCGTDGKTYANICLLDCENRRRYNRKLPPIEVACETDCETCKKEAERCTCAEIYSPVCGYDGVTYSNRCQLDCVNFQRELEGLPPVDVVCENVCDSCSNDCQCEDIYAPICTSTGENFNNRCELSCANSIRVEEGLPPFEVACQNTCEACYIKPCQ